MPTLDSVCGGGGEVEPNPLAKEASIVLVEIDLENPCIWVTHQHDGSLVLPLLVNICSK